MWIFQGSTFNQNPLTDAYMDYCFHEYKALIRHYNRLDDKTEWGFARFCLQSFLDSGGRPVRYKFSRIEKAYMKDAIAYLQEHAVSLWQDSKADPAYKQELGISYKWSRHLKQVYRNPPRNHYELDLVFGTLECFMLLEEKKLL